jgi:phenylpropionate dioxygenase-like ring-hydroxylating dioxygenase large terminal subunit
MPMSAQVAPQAYAKAPRDIFHPVLRADALREKPIRVTISGDHYALFRANDGKAAAVRDRCPHRFAALSGGTVRPDGRLACPYHGWHFDADGYGVSPSQPSVKNCDVEAMCVREAEEYLWLAHKDAASNALPVIRPTDPNLEFAGTFTHELDAALEHALDIFSETEHPAWVHRRLAWDDTKLDEVRFEHAVEGDTSVVDTSGPQRPSVMGRLLGLRPGDRFNNHWVTRFDPVRCEFFLFWTDGRTGERRPLSVRIVVFLVPVAERKTNLHAFVYTSFDHPLRRLLLPVIKKVVVYAGRLEGGEDKAFLRKNMLDAPTTAKGMRLGPMDKAVAHNRSLLTRLYYEREGTDDGGARMGNENGRNARGRSLQLTQ